MEEFASLLQKYWPYLLDGLWFNVKLTLFAMVGGIVLGTFLALARLSSIKPLSLFATAYINGVRSIPLLMVLFWFFLGMPLLLGILFESDSTLKIGALRTAFITFTLFEAAYYAEIMRAGIQSIPRGQVSAGYALGLTYSQNMRLIVVPQAFRNMLPVLLTQTIVLFQDVSLVSLMGMPQGEKDFVSIAKWIKDSEQTSVATVGAYLTIGIVYFIICFSLSSIVKKLQKKIAIVR